MMRTLDRFAERIGERRAVGEAAAADRLVEAR